MISCVGEKGGKVSISGLENGSKELDILEICLRMGEKELTANGIFNQALMLKILKFAQQTAEAERNSDGASAQEGIQLWVHDSNNSTDLLPTYTGLYQRLGEAPTFIGYPTESNTGTLISSTGVAAINQGCPNKEAAWELLTILLNQNHSLSFESSLKKDNAAYQPLHEKVIEHYNLTPESAAEYQGKYLALVEAIGVARIQTQVELIIMEEAEYYFQGIKPVEEIVDVIANRVTLYLEERK